MKKKQTEAEKHKPFEIQELDDAALSQVEGGLTTGPTINNQCNTVAHCGG